MQLITVSGLPGSGTSTLCRVLEEQTGWAYLNTGSVFRQMAQENGVSLADFGRRAEADGEIDRQLDDRMIDLAQQEQAGCILEGRLMGWMAHRRNLPSLKVWVHADIETRVKRVSGRDEQSVEGATAAIREREQSERARYAQHHDIDLADLTIYDLVLDSAQARPDELLAQVLRALP